MDAPRRHQRAKVTVSRKEAVSTIGLEIAKHVFQAQGADAAGQVRFRKRLTGTKQLGFFAGQAARVVAMATCSRSHYWAREINRLGHTARLIPPTHVKPFRRGGGCQGHL
jgi:transposase